MTVQMTGLVLAGGASTRMGRDKATIEIDGERLVDRAVRRLAACCTEVLLAAGPARPLAVPGARSIRDAPGAGPLAGIVAALQVATTELVAVAGADTPDISPEIFVALASRWDGEAGVVARVNGQLQPLHAVYATSWSASYAQLLADGNRSARWVLERLGAQVIGPEIWHPLDPAGAFAHSLNWPEDLAAYRDPPPPPPRG